jgi:hypothetical protein
MMRRSRWKNVISILEAMQGTTLVISHMKICLLIFYASRRNYDSLESSHQILKPPFSSSKFFITPSFEHNYIKFIFHEREYPYQNDWKNAQT